MTKLILVEDDIELAEWVADYLQSKGYEVTLCHRGDTAVDMILEQQPDVVLLDGMLPGKDGLDVCKEVRHSYSGPIIMLTARDEEIDEVLGLEVGADDYLTKPVKPRILLARIKAALRRHQDNAEQQQAPQKVSLSGLEIVHSSRSVSLDGQDIKISSNEFDVLWLLALRAGEVVERNFLINELRGFDNDGFDRSIDLRVSRLRKKLGDDSSEPYRIKTIWGKGYLLAKDAW